MASLWSILAVAVIVLAAIVAIQVVRKREIERLATERFYAGRCVMCGADLRFGKEVCPKCGYKIEPIYAQVWESVLDRRRSEGITAIPKRQQQRDWTWLKRIAGRRLYLFEVARWGNDQDEDGPDGLDTCFLVRATSVEQAAQLVDPILKELPHERVCPWAQFVNRLGKDDRRGSNPRILRGPYYLHAISHDWPSWTRSEVFDPWQKVKA